MTELCGLPHWEIVLILGATQLLSSLAEFWLGKTQKVQSGSILELIFNLVVSMVRQIKK
jgi:hypothetical protein